MTIDFALHQVRHTAYMPTPLIASSGLGNTNDNDEVKCDDYKNDSELVSVSNECVLCFVIMLPGIQICSLCARDGNGTVLQPR